LSRSPAVRQGFRHCRGTRRDTPSGVSATVSGVTIAGRRTVRARL